MNLSHVWTLLVLTLLFWGCTKEEVALPSEKISAAEFPESKLFFAEFPDGEFLIDEFPEFPGGDFLPEDFLSEAITLDEEPTKNWGNLSDRYNWGYHNNYYWGVWKDRGAAAMEFPNSWHRGTFKLSYWNMPWWNIRDVVGGLGWRKGNGRTIGYNFNAWGRWDFIGIYGWACTPRVEYYVVENENGAGINGDRVGSYYVDGTLYDFYAKWRYDYNSCSHKKEWFLQFISKRRYEASANRDHYVNMQKHINYWNYWSRQVFGYNMGSYGYQKFAIEAYGGRQGGMQARVW